MPPMLDRLYAERETALALVDEITAGADADERDLSDAESQLIARNQARIADEIDPQLARLEAVELTRSAHARAETAGGPAPRSSSSSPTPLEPDTIYRSFAEYARDQMICRFDQIAQRAGGSAARAAAEQRIARAVAHTTSPDVPGLLPPQYLTTLFEVINTARPIVQSARSVPLTSGMLRYPNIVTKPTVGKQTAEKTEAPSSKLTVNFVDVPADTYVGAGNISWQVINWSTPDALALFFDLMAEQYAIQTEAAAGTVIAAAPAGPALADDSLGAWMGAVAAAAGAIHSATGRRANVIYADVETGYHVAGIVSQTSPIFLPAGGFSLSSGTGNIAGLTLIVSSGLPADTVVVADSSALLCAETSGAPVELRAVEPALGGMEVGIIGAFVAKSVDTAAFSKLQPPAIP